MLVRTLRSYQLVTHAGRARLAGRATVLARAAVGDVGHRRDARRVALLGVRGAGRDRDAALTQLAGASGLEATAAMRVVGLDIDAHAAARDDVRDAAAIGRARTCDAEIAGRAQRAARAAVGLRRLE